MILMALAARKGCGCMRRARVLGALRSGLSRKSSSGRRLTKAQRDALPARAFAWPERREYPIHDREHVQAALGRFARFQRRIPPAQRGRVRRRLIRAARRFGIHSRLESSK